MPEGPETLRQVDELSDVLVGKKLTQVYFYHSQPDEFRAKLAKSSVKSIEPHGKAIVINFKNELSIYSHNNLYGKWKVLSHEEALKKNPFASLRLSLSTKKIHACLFSASDIEVIPTNQLSAHPYIKSLGPNCLDKDLDWKNIKNRLTEAKFQKRKIKALLLDQKFVAGIGNYLRNEILFDSGIMPELKVFEISDKKLDNLAKSIISIPKRSYLQSGFTRKKSEYENLLKSHNEPAKLRFYVYGRMNLPCYKCQTKIKRLDSSNQPMYICPVCQSD